MSALWDERPVPVERGVAIPDGYLLTTRLLRFAYFGNGTCVPGEHSHPEHLVFWAEQGSISLDIAGERWSAALGQGIFVPAGVAHDVGPKLPHHMGVLHVLPAAWEGPTTAARPVRMESALREMLLLLAGSDMPKEQRLRAQRVCLELVTEEVHPIPQLPLPADPRIQPIAEAILADPADDRSIENWAWLTSTSPRTLARAFRSATGQTFTEWRTQARMAKAVDLLSGGLPVGVVARRVGYSTNSAFSAAFHRVMGKPPQRYLATQFR